MDLESRSEERHEEGEMTKPIRVFVLLFSISAALSARPSEVPLLVGPAGASQSVPETKSLFIACSPERPLVQLGQSVVLRAWIESPPDHALRYQWSVTAGVIRGEGKEVTWDLKGAGAGIYRAELKGLDDTSGQGIGCTVRVAVSEPERSTHVAHETGRAFLLKGKKEADGYGLYSYLLLGSHPDPDDTTRDRFLKALQAYMASIEDISQLEEATYSRVKLNITYLPLETAAPEGAAASWLLEHYDYPRARRLLDALPGSRKSGIYLVSLLKPLADAPAGPYLLQDLSTIPTSPRDLVSWWVREFLAQAAQEHFWEPRTGELLTLRLRTTIAVLANGLPETLRALNSWIAWIK